MKLGALRAEEKEFNDKTCTPVLEKTLASKTSSKESKKNYENPANVIRWRYGNHTASFEDKDIPSEELGTYQTKYRDIESNARIIEWSDGTYQMALGKQLFDLRFEEDDSMKLFTKLGDYLVSKSEVNKKVFLIPASGSEQYKLEDYLKVAEEYKKVGAPKKEDESEFSVSSESK